MPGDEQKKLCTVDHANKAGEHAARARYAFWLKKIKEIKELRGADDPDVFRRDQEMPFEEE